MSPLLRPALLVVVMSCSSLARADWPYTDATAEAGIVFAGTVGPAFPPPAGYPGDPNAPQIVQRISGSGAAVGDYDDDGDLDLYLLGYEGFPNVLLRNDLEGGVATFTDVTAAAGVGDLGLSRVAHFADLDDDGDLDLLLLNENDADGTHPPSRLFRNDGNGSFTDVSAGSGFAPLGYLRCGAALADYDGDGFLDVFVTAWTHFVGFTSYFPGSNRLYRNLGDFVFADVTDAVGLGGQSTNAYTAIFQDFDDDRRPDLFVAVDGWPDEMYRNTPSGFVRVTDAVGANHAGNDMGVACVDVDHDGDLDLYTTNITGPTFGLPTTNCLYRNMGTPPAPSFSNVAPGLGIEDTFWGWGVEFTDAANDGDPDLIAVTGYDEFVAYWAGPDHPLYGTPSVFFRNEGGVFTRHLGPAGDDGRGVVAFDYDRDGDEDLLVTNVNGPVRLWRNDTASGHWLGVAATQVRGNRRAVGATVYVRTGVRTQRRTIRAGDSFLVGGPPEVHFGLGSATSVDDVWVEWTDGSSTHLSGVAADQLITIVQPPLGDLDGSGAVDFVDLLMLISGWGPCPSRCAADLDGSGAVDFGDLLLLLGNWG